ncbi:hypothetical protein [Bacillus thuringiensis]|uniref:hypothetical protein n=1 Tax=Bacillus thuringiensis TaxID=1428 RepID=UPI001CC918EA|nr:hypothetical protein [Bacillus thuringiensis]MBZ8125615.1 hypothetical protein [Bacillus thuringiensis]
MSKVNETELKTSSLLFDEAPLLVRPEMAKRVGLNESIVIQQVHYWLENKRKSTKPKDLEKERTYRDGRFWCYNSYPEWQEQFPFWSQKTIERIFSNLEKNGILISGVFNEWKADRTKWYTIDYEALDRYEKNPKKKSTKKKQVDVEQTPTENIKEENLDLKHTDKLSSCDTEHTDNLSSPIGQVVVTNQTSCREESDKLSSPIPEITSEITPKTTAETSLNSSSSLESENSEQVSADEIVNDEEEELTKTKLLMIRNCLYETMGEETPKTVVSKIINHIKSNPSFNYVCKKDIQLAYGQLFADAQTKTIHDKMIYFANGIILKTENRLVSGGTEINPPIKKVTPYTGNVPLYNWLEQ